MIEYLITLKQHTPLLHFQSEQKNATLRASEVKPRFLRWLEEQEQSQRFEQPFKMRVISKNPKKINSPLPMRIGKDKEPILYENVEIKLHFYSEGDKKLFEEFFPKFLLETNFGARQSKGYGSYTIAPLESNLESNLESIKMLPCYFSYFKIEGSLEKVLYAIDIFHKTIRGGINYGGVYFKSLMYSYAKSRGFRWDKKAIKLSLLSDKLEKQKNKHKSSEESKEENLKLAEKDFRDMLGFATQENEIWRSDRYYRLGQRVDKNNKPVFDKKNKPVYNYITLSKKYYTKKENISNGKLEKENLEKFKSPITYKPIKINDNTWHTFILYHNVEDKKVNVCVCRKDNRCEKDLELYPFSNLENYLEYIGNLKESHIKNHFTITKHPTDNCKKNRQNKEEKHKSDLPQTPCEVKDLIIGIYKEITQNKKQQNKNI